jgi:hypothetical protein
VKLVRRKLQICLEERMAGTLDKISLTLYSMRKAIKEKFGDDGETRENAIDKD